MKNVSPNETNIIRYESPNMNPEMKLFLVRIPIIVSILY